MYYYILNPSAGNSAINPIQDKLKKRLDELGIGGEFAKTTGPGDATKMATSAITKGFNTIVAVGGDGTVNEIINGITRDKVAVGIIPIGRSNKLANHLGINNWQQACEVLAARRLVAYNLMAAGQHYFLSECRVTATVVDGEYNCRVRVDERYELESPFTQLTIINQKFNDPSLENKLMATISTDTPQRSLMSRLFKGTARANVAKSRFRANRIVLETSPPAEPQLDGKNFALSTPITIKLTERQIRFISEKQST